MIPPQNEIHFGPGEEFRKIRRMIRRLGTLASGIGDDAAVLDIPRGEQLVVSIDTSVEDVHFKRGWLTALEIGYRAGTAALSDLAAMGATGLGLLASITVPESWLSELDGLSGGIGGAAAQTNLLVFGGDTTSGKELSITVTVLGTVREPLRRNSARVGDRVYVTGKLGGPSAALRLLQRGKPVPPEYRERFALPKARIIEGRWLSGHGARAAIDISDGLISDAGHIAAASQIRMELHLDKLPLIDGVGPFDAARGGDEYELIATSSIPLDTAAFLERFGIPLTEIGVAVEGAPGVVTLIDSQPVDFAVGGFDHFRKG
jgi:thiamine-monophosphate kinase